MAGPGSVPLKPGVKASMKITKDLIVTGLTTLLTPLGAASANQSVKRETITVNISGGGIMLDGATYVCSIPMRRAGVVKAISVSAHAKVVGGTNTVAFAKKNGGTSVNLISTATIDPTAVPTAVDVAQALTLTAVAADLAFVAGDCLKVTQVCGTMGTDGHGYAYNFDVEYTDV